MGLHLLSIGRARLGGVMEKMVLLLASIFGVCHRATATPPPQPAPRPRRDGGAPQILHDLSDPNAHIQRREVVSLHLGVLASTACRISD